LEPEYELFAVALEHLIARFVFAGALLDGEESSAQGMAVTQHALRNHLLQGGEFLDQHFLTWILCSDTQLMNYDRVAGILPLRAPPARARRP
jgi:hypothetical protein